MRNFFLALVAATPFSAAMSTVNHSPHEAYAQENAGAQSVYFNQARSGDPDFPETGFFSSGLVKCPDGRALGGSIIFGFSALKSPLDDTVKGSWSALVFAVNREDTGALTELSVDEGQFEAKGNWTGGIISGSKTNSTALMCDGMPLGGNTMVTISGECGQDVDVSFAADNGITGTFSGDTTCTAGDTSQQFTLTVESPDFFGSDDPLPLTGMWTTIHTEDGTFVASGFTPLTITGNSSTIYKVTVSDYAGISFELWDSSQSLWEGDQRSNTRTVILSSDTTVTAYYDSAINLVRGFTELTSESDEQAPDLTVRAALPDGNQTLHMWTIILPTEDGSTESGQQSYKVYMHDYQDIVFDHWDDGSTDRIRELTIGGNTTATAYYRTG